MWPWLPPHPGDDLELDAGDVISSNLPELLTDELNDSLGPTLESTFAGCSMSSSLVSVEGLFLLGSGGNGIDDGLLWLMSSCVGEEPSTGGGKVVVDLFECFLECIATSGCSNLLLPGHGAATETSLQGKCS